MLDWGWLRTTFWREDSYKAQNTKNELRKKQEKNSVFLASTRSSLFFLKFSFLKKKIKIGTKTFAEMRQTFSSGDNIQASMLFY